MKLLALKYKLGINGISEMKIITISQSIESPLALQIHRKENTQHKPTPESEYWQQ